MKAQAGGVVLAGGVEQRGRLLHWCAELVRQIELNLFALRCQSHHDDDIGAAEHLTELVELRRMIDDEVPDAELVPRPGDGAPSLHRVHVKAPGLWETSSNKLHLSAVSKSLIPASCSHSSIAG